MISYYEYKIKDNNNVIWLDGVIYANNEIEAFLKLEDKIKAILIEGLEDNQSLIINKIAY